MSGRIPRKRTGREAIFVAGVPGHVLKLDNLGAETAAGSPGQELLVFTGTVRLFIVCLISEVRKLRLTEGKQGHMVGSCRKLVSSPGLPTSKARTSFSIATQAEYR